MIRLFTAIELPDRARLTLAGFAGGVPGARWVPPENMHLTLRFIGEVDEPTAADLDAALAGLRAPPFDLTIAGAGGFSRGKYPAMLWAGVDANAALLHLQDRVESVLVRAGCAADGRKFTPHVTLARLDHAPRDRVEAFIAAHALLRLAPFTVRQFTLFSSHHGREHPTYIPEARYDFG